MKTTARDRRVLGHALGWDQVKPTPDIGYRLPDYLASVDDFDRLRHRDLEDMTHVALFTEEVAVGDALTRAVVEPHLHVQSPEGPCYSIPASAWLLERVQRVRAEARRRGSR
jgi:hypothetical protein